MPWYGVVLLVPACALALFMVLFGLAAIVMAGRKTPKPPRGRS